MYFVNGSTLCVMWVSPMYFVNGSPLCLMWICLLYFVNGSTLCIMSYQSNVFRKRINTLFNVGQSSVLRN